MSNDGKILSWLKKIFSVSGMSLIIAVIGLYFAYNTFVKEKGGELLVTINDEEVPTNNTSRQVILFYNTFSTNISDYIPLTPTFTNVGKYSLTGFALQHIVSASSPIAVSDEYTMIQKAQKYVYNYDPNQLPAHFETFAPFYNWIVSGDGATSIRSTVTYDGCVDKGVYTTNIVWKNLSKQSNHFAEWEKNAFSAANTMNIKSPFDLYLSYNGNVYSYLNITQAKIVEKLRLVSQDSQSQVKTTIPKKIVQPTNSNNQSVTQKTKVQKPINWRNEIIASLFLFLIILLLVPFFALFDAIFDAPSYRPTAIWAKFVADCNENSKIYLIISLSFAVIFIVANFIGLYMRSH